MQLSDKIKKFSVEQAIDYLNRNPVKNLPKLLDRADTFCKGEFENQRRAIRKACLDPTDAHYPMVQHIRNDVDPGRAQDHARKLLHLRHLLVLHERELGRDLVRGVFPAADRLRLPVHLVFPLHAGRQRRLAKQAAAAAKKK